MVDDRVPGLSSRHARVRVSAAEVAAAKLKVERAEARGEPVDPVLRAIADAKLPHGTGKTTVVAT